jgi:hypothetical protein
MIIDPETVSGAREAVAEDIAKEPLGFAMVKRVEFERRFAFLFPELQEDPDSLLPEARKTRDALVALGKALADDGTDAPAGDTKNLSAAYTPVLSTMSFPSEHALRDSTRETRKRHER